MSAIRYEREPWVPPLPSHAIRKPRRSSQGSCRVTVIGPDRQKLLGESALEMVLFMTLRVRPDVRSVREQPATIHYVDADGVTRRHTFDAIVTFKDGWRLAVVIKPRALADRRGTEHAVHVYAAHLTADVADAVILLTEEDAKPDAVHDAKLLIAAQLHPRPAHDDAVRRQALNADGPVTIAELCSATRLGGEGFRAAARLIADGWLLKASTGRISPETLVTCVRRRAEVAA